MRKHVYLFGLFFLLSACSSKLYIDQSQFLKDGDPIPVVDLAAYRSVQERPSQQSDLAVALAISGGGSRAACFGVGVMLGLEEIRIDGEQDALDQIDYLSSVSGGGFAGGAYINALYEHDYFARKEPFRLQDYVDRHIREDLAYSFTKALLGGNLNPKLWFSFADDGDALEKAIDDQVLGYRRRKKADRAVPSITLGDMFIPAGQERKPVRFPMHITNSTIINTINIFPFTPDILDCYLINGYTHRLKVVEKENLDPFTVPLAVGIKASGSFPVLISNTTLRSSYNAKRKYLHLFDGGVADNIGYETAMHVLLQDQASKKMLFIVDCDNSGNLHTFSKRERAYFSFNVLSRLPVSGLYAKRATLITTINAVAGRFNVAPFYFSFHLFQERGGDIDNEKIDVKEEMKRIIQLLRNQAELTPRDMQITYQLLTQIGTKYTIKPDEQELLFLAGKKVVQLQKEEILAVMKRG